MSGEIQKIGFGAVDDTDKSLKGKSGGGKFGLNHGFITKLEHNALAGKDNTAGDAVDITFMVGEKEFRRRIYDVTRVYDNKGEQIEDEDSPEFIKGYNENMKQGMAVIVHAIKAVGVTQEQINTALRTPPTSFAGWASVVTGLIPESFASVMVDGFLEYQWKIADDRDRTFLELPKNMKGGRFLSPSLVSSGPWVEQNSWEDTDKDGLVKAGSGLRYVDTAGSVHLFSRDSSYIESPKGTQQIDGQDTTAAVTGAANTGMPTGAPKKSAWK
tara:strand:- start:15007 stop:15819 length:813 start_codon:yes stop_codon:yes gene_type:complete